MTRCKRCNRNLKKERPELKGYGPVCFTKVEQSFKEQMKNGQTTVEKDKVIT